MEGRTRSAFDARVHPAPGAGWAWGGVLLLSLATGPAEAAPIRLHSLATPARTRFAPGPAWGRFLAGGPALWAVARAPKIPAHLRLAVQNGRLVETPFVDYLLWRRGLNPARFDRYHPRVGPALEALLPPPTPPVIPPPPPVVPPTVPKPPFNPQPQVPEPGMLPLAVVLAGAALWSRRRA